MTNRRGVRAGRRRPVVKGMAVPETGINSGRRNPSGCNSRLIMEAACTDRKQPMKRLLEGCRILIVEDDFYQASDTRGYLATAGATIAAASGRIDEIMQLVEDRRFDAAVLDINLGNAPCFDVARCLRDKRIPFLFLTGYDAGILPDDLATYDLIIKPAGPTEVIERLARVVKGFSRSDQSGQ